MKINILKSKYKIRLELSFLIALIIVVMFFSLYPQFAQKFGINKSSLEPDFIIMDIPRTIQLLKKIEPPKPEIPAKFEEVELIDDVEIAAKVEIDSSFVVDSTEIALRYYEQLLPYLDLEKFDPGIFKQETEPLARYHEYLNKRLTEIFSEKKSYKSRTHIDDVLAQSMGRDPRMLSVDIGSVVDATKNYFKSNSKRKITVDNIIKSEKHWYILELLWSYKGQSIFEIYADESIRKKNTIVSLKESMNNLKENGLVFEVERFERSHYFPSFSPDEMIEIVNKLLAQDLSNHQKDKLSLYLNFVIINS